jgi:hypothetical protein
MSNNPAINVPIRAKRRGVLITILPFSPNLCLKDIPPNQRNKYPNCNAAAVSENPPAMMANKRIRPRRKGVERIPGEYVKIRPARNKFITIGARYGNIPERQYSDSGRSGAA